MRRHRGSLVAVAFVGSLAARAAAEPCERSAPHDRLGMTGERLVGLRSLSLVAAAAVPPLTFIPSGADHELRVFSQRKLGGRHALEPVTLLVPYVAAGATLIGYGVSLAFDACGPRRTQAAMLQAFVLSASVSLSIKFVTGRNWPNGGLDPTLPDRLEHPERAREFEPFRVSITAFPSGHAATTFSLAAALRAANPDGGFGVWLGYPVALAVGAGMWLGDHHWASDIVSGALLGEAIGGAVGAAFVDTRAPSAAFSVWPLESGEMVAGFIGVF
jgi:membrane-associated phospholipid phosphatase